MASVYSAAVSHFAVFCPGLGPDEESTHEQLLFYAAAGLPAFYPITANDYYGRSVHLRRRSSGAGGAAGADGTGKSPTRARAVGPGAAAAGQERVVSLDTKLREIGLGAALVAFAGSFAETDGRARFHTVRSEKRRTVVYEPEEGVLVQLAVVLPRRVRPFGKEKDAYSIEFLAGELDDQALRTWLAHEFCAFRTLFGPVNAALRTGLPGRQRIKRQLEAFFGKTLWAWDRRWDPKRGDELDLLCALRPLPLAPIGPVSLGGFDEFWHDLASAAEDADGSPLVATAVVLWRGEEAVWASWLADGHCRDAADPADEERAQILRALVAWSRAVYAPAFEPPGSLPPDGSSAGERQAGPRQPPSQRAPATIAMSPPPLPRSRTRGAEAGGWTLPGASWLWGRRDAALRPAPLRNESGSGGSGGGGDGDSGSEASDAGSAAVPGDMVLGGLSRVLSRAVDALVEPRAQTPPEVDPAFASDDRRSGTASEQMSGRQQLTPGLTPATAERYTLTAADIDETHGGSGSGGAFARDSDAESLQSVGSRASVQTTRTTVTASVALNRHAAVGRSSVASLGRMRSNTVQHGNPLANALAAVPGLPLGWPPGPMGRAGLGYARAPSIASNASFATAESTLLRDDTRVSGRSWWPTAWSWGAGSMPPLLPAGLPPDADLPAAAGTEDDVRGPSGIDPALTFLYTGDIPFPGLDAEQQQPGVTVAESPRSSTDGGSSALETISLLGQAMEEEIPAAYEHGAGVDCSRGVVLSPRGLPGMLYDSRLLRLLFPPGVAAGPAPAEHQLCVDPGPDARSNRTLVYKYGDLLFLVFAAPDTADDPNEAKGDQPARLPRGRRARGARGARTRAALPDAQRQRFDGAAARAVEQTVLRYAESLQAATRRDMAELAQQRRSEAQLAQQRRIPPYVLREGGGPLAALVRTSWRAQPLTPVSHSYAGYAGSSASAGARGRADAGAVPATVRHALSVVAAETERPDGAAVCVRMHDKGWVAGSADNSPDGPRCYCLVDQPKATLADAHCFLARVARRAAAHPLSGPASPT